MQTTPHKSERLHSLDSLRAIMMMLGIVLHTSITYIGGNPSSGWPMRDPNTESEFLRWLLLAIHNFRMPIFMLIAGFFAALLFYDRSPRKMLINRTKRIVFPFAVFLILLWPLVTLAFSYSNGAFNFTAPFDSVIGTKFVNTRLSSFGDLHNWAPESTMHLWFLYYLILFSLASFALASLMKYAPGLSQRIHSTFNFILKKPLLKISLLPLLTFGTLLLMQASWVSTSTSFIPDSGTFMFYFSFYMVGWVLFKSKHLLTTFLSYDRLILWSAVAIFSVYYFADFSNLPYQYEALIESVCVWLFFFGFTGIFMRYFSNHSALMRYVSDSAYWVYLLHLPLTALLPGLISNWEASGLVKFLVVVVATTVICFTTYHYLVRSTFIGAFLNGRKYSQKLSDIRAAEVNTQVPKPSLT